MKPLANPVEKTGDRMEGTTKISQGNGKEGKGREYLFGYIAIQKGALQTHVGDTRTAHPVRDRGGRGIKPGTEGAQRSSFYDGGRVTREAPRGDPSHLCLKMKEPW